MEKWDFSPPPPSELGDRDVALEGDHLAGQRIALLVTGGIAAMKAPLLARALRRQGAEVTAFVSEEALRYTTRDALSWSTDRPVVTRLTPAAEHLGGGEAFDAYLVAPATYNTINKMRHGIADNGLTATLAAALGKSAAGETKVLVAPTMHGTMHNPVLTESLEKLDALGVTIIPPREAHGKHNLPDEAVIVAAVCRAVSRSPLKGVPLLVTGGPTPVPIDAIRRLTNHFQGRLGAFIVEDLYLRGAEALLIHGEGAFTPPAHLPYRLVRSYDAYRQAVLDALAAKPYACGIFSAAVADFQPKSRQRGKIPSGGAGRTLQLVPTEKVIRLVRARFPDLVMVTFKYEEEISHDRLIEIARKRLAEGYAAVVANRGGERGPAGEQVAHLVTKGAPPSRFVGKRAIARGIVTWLETALSQPEGAQKTRRSPGAS